MRSRGDGRELFRMFFFSGGGDFDRNIEVVRTAISLGYRPAFASLHVGNAKSVPGNALVAKGRRFESGYGLPEALNDLVI